MSANLMSLARSGGKFLKLFGDRKMMKILPYDAEVEWLGGQASGQQYVQIDYIPTRDFVIDFKFEIITGLAQWSAVGYWSGGSTSAGNYLATGVGINGDIFRTVVYSGTDSAEFKIPTSRIVEGSFDIASTTVNGVTKINANVVGSHGTVPSRIIVKGKFYYTRIRDGLIFIDLIPVRVGPRENCVGYLYDRVSGRLFGNAGTGEFLIGPDKTI